MKRLIGFAADEQGQDLIEYTLLIGLILLASAALVIAGGGNIQSIWAATTNELVAANAAS